ncbi:hypothetical protein C8J27_101354 [Rhodobacter aestuarii]|uniref:17 kDa surface antigen n=1 Tax=Rhodobacter aestuarii TaxID=453582 RepID=A0A1N7J3A4_9RHOB|nr:MULTISPECIES: lipoprotein [Rhodobacter]PTV97242.1 hypothetical protein C8J27_101354 [Rhodobacter aestuarii]SIS43717.1 hypothetical protein SAMN05421580_101288 [Rhodobacter aestuarii]SOB99331.1 hypothetical protein SAMN05877809_102422 [Rhodobacter sp. JA431]
MRKSPFFFALLAATALAGCMETQGDRAIAGAAAGAVLADATDNNVLAGAAIGALAGGATCNAGIGAPCY